MTAPVVWGLLSTAAINDAVLTGCANSDLVSFRAVASRDRDRAAAWALARGIPRAYGSYGELLADPEVEAVYISLPNSLHVEWSVKALEAGKHVLCEKPLSSRPDAVEEAFEAASRSQRILAEAFMYRFHRQTAEVLRLLGAGAIGPVRYLHATLSFTMSDPAADIRTSPDLGGGALMDLGCYCVSAFRLFAGEPERVIAHSVRAPAGVDIRFLAILVAADGAAGHFDCAMDLPRRDRLELVGTSGVIELADPWHCRGAPVIVRAEGKAVQHVHASPKDAYRSELEAVSRAIRSGDTVTFGREDAVAQARALSALMAAASTGAVTRVVPGAGP